MTLSFISIIKKFIETRDKQTDYGTASLYRFYIIPKLNYTKSKEPTKLTPPSEKHIFLINFFL
jgi:hypothetical protein